tara:strand:+ start:1555 stop:2460 length:906 start_codon:yes stop_codon:yes gene_type:complete
MEKDPTHHNGFEIQKLAKFDLKKCTFIIPLRIDTDDRMRNIITTLCYLLRNFDTNVIIKEFDKESIFDTEVVPQLEQILTGEELRCIDHQFEQTDEYTFHRTRLLNDMLWQVKTPVTVNYDADILLPIDSYILAQNLIINGNDSVEGSPKADLVYPYGYGNYQMQVTATDEEINNFISTNYSFKVFNNLRKWDAKFGFVQFFNTEIYKKWGGENEGFIAYGYEDDERYHRFSQLGEVGRVNDLIFHLEHKRTSNSWFNNPHCEDNKKLWEILRFFNKQQLIDYYENVDYIKTHNGQEQVSV